MKNSGILVALSALLSLSLAVPGDNKTCTDGATPLIPLHGSPTPNSASMALPSFLGGPGPVLPSPVVNHSSSTSETTSISPLPTPFSTEDALFCGDVCHKPFVECEDACIKKSSGVEGLKLCEDVCMGETCRLNIDCYKKGCGFENQKCQNLASSPNGPPAPTSQSKPISSMSRTSLNDGPTSTATSTDWYTITQVTFIPMPSDANVAAQLACFTLGRNENGNTCGLQPGDRLPPSLTSLLTAKSTKAVSFQTPPPTSTASATITQFNSVTTSTYSTQASFTLSKDYTIPNSIAAQFEIPCATLGLGESGITCIVGTGHIFPLFLSSVLDSFATTSYHGTPVTSAIETASPSPAIICKGPDDTTTCPRGKKCALNLAPACTKLEVRCLFKTNYTCVDVIKSKVGPVKGRSAATGKPCYQLRNDCPVGEDCKLPGNLECGNFSFDGCGVEGVCGPATITPNIAPTPRPRAIKSPSTTLVPPVALIFGSHEPCNIAKPCDQDEKCYRHLCVNAGAVSTDPTTLFKAIKHDPRAIQLTKTVSCTKEKTAATPTTPPAFAGSNALCKGISKPCEKPGEHCIPNSGETCLDGSVALLDNCDYNGTCRVVG